MKLSYAFSIVCCMFLARIHTVYAEDPVEEKDASVHFDRVWSLKDTCDDIRYGHSELYKSYFLTLKGFKNLDRFNYLKQGQVLLDEAQKIKKSIIAYGKESIEKINAEKTYYESILQNSAQDKLSEDYVKFIANIQVDIMNCVELIRQKPNQLQWVDKLENILKQSRMVKNFELFKSDYERLVSEGETIPHCKASGAKDISVMLTEIILDKAHKKWKKENTPPDIYYVISVNGKKRLKSRVKKNKFKALFSPASKDKSFTASYGDSIKVDIYDKDLMFDDHITSFSFDLVLTEQGMVFLGVDSSILEVVFSFQEKKEIHPSVVEDSKELKLNSEKSEELIEESRGEPLEKIRGKLREKPVEKESSSQNREQERLSKVIRGDRLGTYYKIIDWISFSKGNFNMGDERYKRSKPVHLVEVEEFMLSKSEVTVKQYKECVNAGRCVIPESVQMNTSCNWGKKDLDLPMNCVSWKEARRFAMWIGANVDLPTEAEWEYAARNAGRVFSYPWGESGLDCNHLIYNDKKGYGCGKDHSWPVCSKNKGNTQQGLCDILGNLSEWLLDDFAFNYQGAPKNSLLAYQATPICDQENCTKVVRGGSWITNKDWVSTTIRNSRTANTRAPDVGFRLSRHP